MSFAVYSGPGTATIPGGSTGQIQYDNGGAFAGAAGLIYNGVGGSGTYHLSVPSQGVNTGYINASGFSLTGADATTAISLSGTWNTSGAPTFLDINVTNTASNSQSFIQQWRVGGAYVLKIRQDGLVLGTGSISIGGYLQASGGVYCNLALISGPSANVLQSGDVDKAAPSAQTFQAQSVVAGASNTAGQNWTFNGSRGTGTGVGGDIIFQTAKAGSSGTAQNTLSEAFRIKATGPAVVVSGGGVTVANLPAAIAGGLAFVTDATQAAGTSLGSTVTGGGAVKRLVYSDGTNWLLA